MKTAGSLIFIFLAVSLFAQESAKETGIRAFRDIASVLTSPRCLNCHVPGDNPLQGEDNHAHNMKVARGTEGEGGSPAMHCANCHQDENVATPHAPPGTPGWRMPSAATRMAWQGLTSAQLCQTVKDPATNGKRSLTDLIEHVSTDKIVNWGWNPGPGRTPPPLSHQQFVQRVKEWAAAGAPCPE
jgi:hypothetical protein